MTRQDTSAGSPRSIRHGNTLAALRALFDHGRMSRAELARQLGLNRSSSGHIVAELLASDLVRELPESPQDAGERTRAGRPGILLELEPAAAHFVGAEIGVEHLTTLRIDLAGGVVDCRVEPFDGRSVTAAGAVDRAVAQAFDGLPPEIHDLVEGFGLAAPAQMDADGVVNIAPLLGWQSVDLGSLARDALPGPLPVMVENDANAFAFGEGYRNLETKSGVTLFLVIESGVGGGIMIDGTLFRGGHGLAGEIGHLILRDGAELEELLGLERILLRHGRATGLKTPSLPDFLGAVRDRDPSAVEIAEDWAQDLARALVAACRLIDPTRIVLGGALAALYPLVQARVAHHMAGMQAATFPDPEVVVHESPETGAAYGAACMLHRRFLSAENDLLRELAK